MTESDVPKDLARAVGESCLCLAVQRASRAVGRRFDAALRPLGLTNWQFSLLAMLEPQRPVTIGGLAEALGMDRTTLASNLKPLQRRGYVEIAGDAADRRVRRVALTLEGARVLAAAAAHWQAVNAEVEARLGEVDPITLRTALRELSAS